MLEALKRCRDEHISVKPRNWAYGMVQYTTDPYYPHHNETFMTVDHDLDYDSYNELTLKEEDYFDDWVQVV